MSLVVKDIINIMESYAPVHLMESYDNVGLMIGDSECKITKILVSLDCTLKVISEAEEKGCNLIITHHPLLFKKPSNITTDTLLGKKIISLIKNNINVYSSHTNLDSAPNGINEILMRILNFNDNVIIDNYNNRLDSGIGRIATLEKSMYLGELVDLIKNKLNIDKLRFCGNENMKIRKIAVINGSGQDYIAEVVKKGAECIITGDTTYHYVSDYNEENLAIIDAGHFDTEWPAMKFVAEIIEKSIKDMNFSTEVLLSECNFNPYKFK